MTKEKMQKQLFFDAIRNERSVTKRSAHFLSVVKSFDQINNITSTETIKKHYYDCPRKDVHRMLLLATIKEVYSVWNSKLYESFLTDEKGDIQVITQMVWGKFRDHWNELMKNRNALKRNTEFINGSSH